MGINKEFLGKLFEQAVANPHLRQNYDLRTSSADTSQRMLNALLPGTFVPIHQHEDTTETVVCLCGRDADATTYYWKQEWRMPKYEPTKKDYHSLATELKNKGIWYFTDGDRYKTFISTIPLHISTESIIYCFSLAP